MNYMISALIITFIIPALGIVTGFVRKIIYYILSLINPKFAFVIINYLTFPGVMHHELSHAAMGIITGAKITKINLFSPNGTSLGSVQMIYRGPWLLRCIQECMSAIGPVVCGALSSLLIIGNIIPVISSVAMIFFIYYLLFSIVMHMTMSKPDMICFLRGSAGVYLISLLVCFLARVDLLAYLA